MSAIVVGVLYWLLVFLLGYLTGYGGYKLPLLTDLLDRWVVWMTGGKARNSFFLGENASMRVAVYTIGPGADMPIGVAHDSPTLLSLIEMARLRNHTGVSLHGLLPDGQVVSGEMNLYDASYLAIQQPTPLS